MVLSRRGDVVSISVRGIDLMASNNHASEDQLGRVAGELLVGIENARLLIGGLGLGYTLRAALDAVPADAAVDVAEIVPEVVRWNQSILAPLANRPLEDPRVTVIRDDVLEVIRRGTGRYHAILLDVDNGPEGLSRGNQTLYRPAGLAATRDALAPGGVLAVWSAFSSDPFTTLLREAGFDVAVSTIETTTASARGPVHFIWFARRGA
jgi:spermidine synthase